MTMYHVKWEIVLGAESPEEAAALALEIQRDHESWATVFAVTDHSTGKAVSVDLGHRSEL